MCPELVRRPRVALARRALGAAGAVALGVLTIDGGVVAAQPTRAEARVGPGTSLRDLGVERPILLSSSASVADVGGFDLPAAETSTAGAYLVGFDLRMRVLSISPATVGDVPFEAVVSASVNDRTAVQYRVVQTDSGFVVLSNGWIQGPFEQVLTIGQPYSYANYLQYESAGAALDGMRFSLQAPPGADVQVEVLPESSFVRDIAPSNITQLKVTSVAIVEKDNVSMFRAEFQVTSDRARQLSIDLVGASGLRDEAPVLSSGGRVVAQAELVGGKFIGAIEVPVADRATEVTGTIVAATEFNQPSETFRVAQERDERERSRTWRYGALAVVLAAVALPIVVLRRRWTTGA